MYFIKTDNGIIDKLCQLLTDPDPQVCTSCIQLILNNNYSSQVANSFDVLQFHLKYTIYFKINNHEYLHKF